MERQMESDKTPAVHQMSGLIFEFGATGVLETGQRYKEIYRGWFVVCFVVVVVHVDGARLSQNCGHQWAYSSFSVWRATVE
jgi:hypothetical protein